MFFKVMDVLEKAGKHGLENPEEMLEREISAGKIELSGKDLIELDVGKEVCGMMRL